MNWTSKQEARDWGKSVQKKLRWAPDFSDQIFNSPAFQRSLRNSDRVLGYIPFRNEAPLKGLYEKIWAQQTHELYFPLCQKNTLLFCRAESWSDVSYDGAFPQARAGLEPLSQTNKASLILVPGLVFDRQGHRIGYGKGFYDRYFRKNPEALRLAIVAKEQISFRSWPHETHDELVDWVLSPSELWTPERKV